MTKKLPAIFIALPVLSEHDNIPIFLENLRAQDYAGKTQTFVCVNQPEAWWNTPEKLEVFHDNARSIELLKNQSSLDIIVLDRSSKGKGWVGRQHGVGFARKEAMKAIAQVANDTDILLSLDADTTFNSNYLRSVVETLRIHPKASALALPYYHRLTGNEVQDRAILRYEVYMRCYAINLLRINSPYAFTALGSAIALTVKNYKSIGGITPRMSGEDFYFLQKLRKKSKILTWNPEKVYPAARFSNRVYFGTGPAMIKGAGGDWSSYPIYHHSWFDEVELTYNLFPGLYISDIVTPMDGFLKEIFPGEDSIWDKLRKNTTTTEKFVWACHQKIDGLRVLQYMKWRQKQSPQKDENNLLELLSSFYPGDEIINILNQTENFNFASSSIDLLNQLRNFLVLKEDEFLKPEPPQKIMNTPTN